MKDEGNRLTGCPFGVSPCFNRYILTAWGHFLGHFFEFSADLPETSIIMFLFSDKLDS